MNDPLWTPSPRRVDDALLTGFMRAAEQTHGVTLRSYDEVYRWSITSPADFWSSVWDHTGVVAQERGMPVLVDGDRLPGARWFPQARLNFAENLLRRRDDGVAIIFRGESGVQRQLTFAELHTAVARAAVALRAAGVEAKDRVAGYLPNLPETVIAMLGAASIGAVWSSCSPDFGTAGVLDRFGQIEPKVLIAADGYFYAGKAHDRLERLGEIVRALPSVERVVVVPFERTAVEVGDVPNAVPWDEFLGTGEAGDLSFASLPFDHPLYIMFSSGTTGPPKCIVHGAGGTLIQHLKEHQLQCDVKPDDRVFYFTTCGWMMWNWLVSALASRATIVLYEGSPFHPHPVLFDLADETGITLFGTSAKYLDAARKFRLEPAATHGLGPLRTITSTGSPLSPDGFDYVYEKVKPDVCLSSISGGTDIISCFVGGNPIGPVWRGEIQARGLGMKVEVFDDDGRSVVGAKGELVCTAPFPSTPTGFWNDPDGSRFHAAYFDRFPGVWCHGDLVELTERGGMVIYGRSDAVLNPGGVRIGTAEIYRQVENLDEVVESIAVGQEWSGDVRIVLFVRLRDGVELSEELAARIRTQIRENTSPRHVPSWIYQVSDIPRTKSGKISEVAVREVIHGRPVKNEEALANPECLDQYRDIPGLQRDTRKR